MSDDLTQVRELHQLREMEHEAAEEVRQATRNHQRIIDAVAVRETRLYGRKRRRRLGVGLIAIPAFSGGRKLAAAGAGGVLTITAVGAIALTQLHGHHHGLAGRPPQAAIPVDRPVARRPHRSGPRAPAGPAVIVPLALTRRRRQPATGVVLAPVDQPSTPIRMPPTVTPPVPSPVPVSTPPARTCHIEVRLGKVIRVCV